MLRPPSIPGSHALLVSIREKDNERLLFVFNLTLEPQDFALPARMRSCLPFAMPGSKWRRGEGGPARRRCPVSAQWGLFLPSAR
ncbi:hypothetical protein GV68_20810 [Pseudorhizobium pelagicum]|uniref:Uncharacterized protein n=1 Tax=Pseudorhizobium pelagicum TaxID=1509405 RepID=A0A922T7Z3_9HYPH|nr:hypothetical protein GV68_20810 [Pseudorhizobium pelagicum]